jgi:hypothetical protein
VFAVDPHLWTRWWLIDIVSRDAAGRDRSGYYFDLPLAAASTHRALVRAHRRAVQPSLDLLPPDGVAGRRLAHLYLQLRVCPAIPPQDLHAERRASKSDLATTSEVCRIPRASVKVTAQVHSGMRGVVGVAGTSWELAPRPLPRGVTLASASTQARAGSPAGPRRISYYRPLPGERSRW